jgi:hypothetical protein
MLTRTSILALALAALAGCGNLPSDSLVEGVTANEDGVRRYCYSSDDCGADSYCTTEDDVCLDTCKRKEVCPAVCAGTCKRQKAQQCDYSGTRSWVSQDPAVCASIRFVCVDGMTPFFDACGCGCEPAVAGEACGVSTCAAGMVCCNASCGICTEPGGICTQQACEPVSTTECSVDADCRVEADYCTGCDCRPLASAETLPVCEGPGVRCFADPCLGQSAACVGGVCVTQ